MLLKRQQTSPLSLLGWLVGFFLSASPFPPACIAQHGITGSLPTYLLLCLPAFFPSPPPCLPPYPFRFWWWWWVVVPHMLPTCLPSCPIASLRLQGEPQLSPLLFLLTLSHLPPYALPLFLSLLPTLPNITYPHPSHCAIGLPCLPASLLSLPPWHLVKLVVLCLCLCLLALPCLNRKTKVGLLQALLVGQWSGSGAVKQEGSEACHGRKKRREHL